MKNQTQETLEHFFAETYTPRKLVGKSENTLRLYKVTFTHFDRFLGRKALLQDLNDDTVSRYLQWRISQAEISPHTVAKDRSQLLAVANFAAKKRFIPEFLDVQLIAVPNDPPQALTVAQLGELFGAAGAESGLICDIPAGLWWESFLRLGFETGERAGALRAMRWDWVDLNSGWVRVPAGVRKGRTRA